AEGPPPPWVQAPPPWAQAGQWPGAGAGTGAGPDVLAGGRQPGTPPPDGNSRRILLGFGIAGGAVLVLGLVVVLVLAGTGVFSGGQPLIRTPGDQPSKPPLAQLCPPASGPPAPEGKVLPTVPGPRVVDADSGISYLRQGAPWRPWDRGSWGEGTLGVQYRTGYYFVTEEYSQGSYLASVLSGKVPATVGDSLTVNLECAGRQVAEDVRRAYYPQPNIKEQVRDERVVVGGRPAWVSRFHLAFSEPGLEAKGETVAVVLVDIGRPDASVLYISVPDTHRQFNAVIDPIIASIAPA
ncbi:MAG TPA: hypothetical protein VGR21_08440, partial [Cryptosporangiaceae bacterium]|nr:hypothetical protein [Cryptosporangiaceae bacterium]